MSMNFKDKTKSFIVGKKEAFKGLKKGHKIAITIAVGTVIVATIFGVIYGMQNKYDILFYDLNTQDSARISKQLEESGVATQIKGGNIYVPKTEVDKLRLELAPSVENGSKGFELMDDGSSLGMTDDEFALKKKRMLNGEIEKTIKTFPQVEDVRVHITDGVKSAFSKEVKSGTSAVSVLLKDGYTLTETQVRSIISLVSASSENIPKENIEVVDQDLNLLSDGLFNSEGEKVTKDNEKIENERLAEKNLNKDLTDTLLNLLEPIFGEGEVKVVVNSDLLFDTEEVNELVVNPNKVVIHEERTEDSSKNTATNGSAVDNNMNNTGTAGQKDNNSSSEIIDYAIGKKESSLVKAPGEIQKLSATVAINGDLDEDTKKEVEDMVASALTLDSDRGDFIKVSSMKFTTADTTDFDAMQEAEKKEKMYKLALMAGGGTLLLITAIAFVVLSNKRTKVTDDVDENIDGVYATVENTEILMAEKIKEDERQRELNLGVSDDYIDLEGQIREYAKGNTDKVVEVLKLWLSE